MRVLKKWYLKLIDLVESGVLGFDSDTEDSLREVMNNGWGENKNRSFNLIIGSDFNKTCIAENDVLMEYLEDLNVVSAE
ncbi:hypothetical protein BMS3Abin15_00261 [bacterium BMS3Abin15]|nr:hypothetical protein BMS3Abin15_00261 [bacterium BMS3Abin15]